MKRSVLLFAAVMAAVAVMGQSNTVKVKVVQGTTAFQDVAAEALRTNAVASQPKTMTVTATPSQPSVVSANGSYAFVGGETVTMS